MDLGADEQQIDFPIVYTNARVGTATLSLDEPGTDLRPLLDLLVEHTPAPTYEPDHPLQLLVTNLAANDYVGRMAVGRIRNGTLRMGSRVTVVRVEEERPDGSIEPGRTVTMTGTVTSLTVAQGIERLDIRRPGPGEIVVAGGHPRGDHRRHRHRSRRPAAAAAPPGRRADPAHDLRCQHLAAVGPRGQVPDLAPDQGAPRPRGPGQRVHRGRPTASPETFEVRGRGELQLAVLIEQMRREGYELQVSRPEVLLREIGGEVQEPYERITIDIPPEFMGTVTASLAARKARTEQMTSDSDGRMRVEAVIPTRGLVGYRGQFLTETRGTGLLHQISEGYGPWAGEVTHRTNGVLVSDRSASPTPTGCSTSRSAPRCTSGRASTSTRA